MKWIKWYPQIWLHSTCQQDLEPAERAAWLNFVCLAAMREPQGQFRFATLEALAQQLLIPKEIIKTALEKCLKAGRIEIDKNLIETIVTITKWGLYQPSYDQFTRKAVYKKPEKKGKSVNAFTKNPTRREEKRREENRIEEKKSPLLPYTPAQFTDRKEEISAILYRRSLRLPGRTIDYITGLTFEFNDVDWGEEIEKKIASLQDHPFKKGANIALQFRNWLANARRFTKERETRDRTGSPAGFKAQVDAKRRAEAEVREKFKDEIAARRLPGGMLPTDLLLKISREEQAILKRIRNQEEIKK